MSVPFKLDLGSQLNYSTVVTEVLKQVSGSYQTVASFAVSGRDLQFDVDITINRLYHDYDYGGADYNEYDQYIRILDDDSNVIGLVNTTVSQNYTYVNPSYHTAVSLETSATITTLSTTTANNNYYVQALILDTADDHAIEHVFNPIGNPSTIVITENKEYNPISQGIIKLNNIRGSDIICDTVTSDTIIYQGSCGVFAYDGTASSSNMFPIYNTCDMDSLNNNDTLSNTVSTGVTGYGAAVGTYDRHDIGNLIDYFLIYPNYGIVAYNGKIAAPGLVSVNYHNATTKPQIVKAYYTNNIESVKVFFNHIEIS